jgi:hypothetical protein
MNKDILKYGFLILLLPILQEVIFNHINLFGFVNPMIYIVFVFVFPVYKNKTSILWASFILGLFIDMLSNEGGIHTFSLVFVSYFRLFFLRFVKGSSLGDEETIDILQIGNSIQVVWILIVSFTHHFLVYLLEQFSFHRFGFVLLKTFLTTILTSILISFALQIFLKKKSNAW